MRSKIEKAFAMFEDFFNGKYDPLQFSCDMEQFLFDNYEDMLKENKEITELLNEDVPDICAEGEQGYNFTSMKNRLKKIYEQAKQIS